MIKYVKRRTPLPPEVDVTIKHWCDRCGSVVLYGRIGGGTVIEVQCPSRTNPAKKSCRARTVIRGDATAGAVADVRNECPSCGLLQFKGKLGRGSAVGLHCRKCKAGISFVVT